jgi:hypothetical protein
MKKLTLLFILVLSGLILLNLYSCKTDTDKTQTTPKEDVKKNTAGKDSAVTKKEVTEQKNTQLEGTWISTEDAKSSIEVKSNTWKELYTGEKTEEFRFATGDTCLANADSKSNTNGKYITVFDPDGNRCFYIVTVNDSKLELSYVGRGNTLTYKKKK